MGFSFWKKGRFRRVLWIRQRQHRRASTQRHILKGEKDQACAEKDGVDADSELEI
jgi:hypothetical protein